jgi:hypothetical protein
MHTNCIALTKIYEGESVDSGLVALEARFAKIDGQYQSVSNLKLDLILSIGFQSNHRVH